MSVETIQTPETPNLNSIAEKTKTVIEKGEEFLVDGTKKMEAFVDRNQQAMQMFCESNKGFQKVIRNKKRMLIS